jgi:hypothetical protein
MLDGESVRRHPTAYVAPTATLIGEATLGRQSSVWFGTVLRADFAAIKVGEQSNIQDLTVIHADRDHPVSDRAAGERGASRHPAEPGRGGPWQRGGGRMPGRVTGVVGEKLAQRIQRACENYVLLAERYRTGAGRAAGSDPGATGD